MTLVCVQACGSCIATLRCTWAGGWRWRGWCWTGTCRTRSCRLRRRICLNARNKTNSPIKTNGQYRFTNSHASIISLQITASFARSSVAIHSAITWSIVCFFNQLTDYCSGDWPCQISVSFLFCFIEPRYCHLSCSSKACPEGFLWRVSNST